MGPRDRVRVAMKNENSEPSGITARATHQVAFFVQRSRECRCAYETR